MRRIIQIQKRTLGIVFVVLSSLILLMKPKIISEVEAANFNAPFPRIGIITFYNTGSGDEIWKNFDLVIIRHYKPGDASRIKAKNPDVILLGTNDLLDDQTGAIEWPAAWRTKYADGSEVFETDHLANTTDWCQETDFGFGPQRYNEWLPQYLDTNTDWNLFDGSFFDTWHSGIWYNNPEQMDFDLDGTPDGGQATPRYLAGLEQIANTLRASSGKLIAAHEAGLNQTNHLNGVGDEDWGAEAGNWGWTLTNQMIPWSQQALGPNINFINIAVDKKAAPGSTRASDDYKYIRLGMGTAALVDFYSVIDEGVSAHRYTYLYDEFEGNLGFPTSQAQQLPGKGHTWVRFFDNGAIIVNGSGQTQTVTDSDLQALTGYGGPYFRFQGAQDSSFNNGKAFNSVTLQSSGGEVPPDGDAIFLFTKPTTLITPIVIDNEPINMTSVGQQPTSYAGSWSEVQRDDAKSDTFYGLGYGWDDVAQPYQITTGSGTAAYNADINVAGQYEVFEWHPDTQADGQGSGCSNVSIKVTHAGGSTTKSVNQQVNAGRWNLLGKFNFNTGTGGRTELQAPGGCTAAADAVKFVWAGSEVPSEIKGDLDKDQDVDIFDYNLLVENFGSTSCGNVADINGDCKVDIFDYNILVENFGKRI